MKLIVPKRDIIKPPARLFIPGFAPAPKFIGAEREVNPGSQAWSSPGTYSFTVPAFHTLSVIVKGAGGGGGGGGASFYGYVYYGGVGGVGGQSSFGPNLIAAGGAGGPVSGTYYDMSPRSPGANGQGSGGDTNTTGGGANPGSYGYNFSLPFYYDYGGNGGYGGRADKAYLPEALAFGSTVQIVVGAGGVAGTQTLSPWGGSLPTAGQPGSVEISWS